MSEVNFQTPGIWASTETGNVYQFIDTTYSRTKPNTISKKNRKIVKWGSDNLLPLFNRQILADNDIKQNLIDTDVDITCGKGLVLYTETIEDGKRVKQYLDYSDASELFDWIEDWGIDNFFRESIQDVKEFGNSWAEIILDGGKKMATSLVSLDAVDCRLTQVEPGRLDSPLLMVADWKNSQLKDDDISEVPLLDILKPDLSNVRGYKCALHLKKRISGQPYYSLVEWHGTKDYAEIANIIPKFHKQGLKNGYMMRYHIKIPISYLESLMNNGKSAEEVKSEIQTQLDAVLKDVENGHKSLVSFINDKMPNPSEWKVEKIETDLKDESYLKLSDHATKVNARGHNLHPVLAGIETSGSLSSGSEILNLINYHVAYKTQRIRDIALRPINLVKNFNFPDYRNIKIGVEDVELTTLDKNPNGQQTVTQ